MALFKKKEEVPKIPTAPSLPPLPSIKDETSKKDLPGLPSFPTSSKNENFNQEMVKSAVSDIPSPEEKEMPVETPESFQLAEGPEEGSLIPSKPSTKSAIPEPPKAIAPTPEEPEAPATPVQLTQPPQEASKQNEPIFVRIDKFQAAQKNFEEIRSKVAEMESILQKIKEVKVQEEEELKGWGEDAEKLKSRLAEIDGDIFSQL